MTGVKPVIYVDTCVILAWILGEKRPPEEMQGVRELARQVDNNEIIMITSTLYQTEILESKMSKDSIEKLDGLFKRSNVKSIPADIRITKLSSELRNHYQQLQTPKNKKGLSTPDAIHLATAIHMKADVFYTFDNGGDKNFLGLLPLNTNVAGYPLKIEKPIAAQPELEL